MAKIEHYKCDINGCKNLVENDNNKQRKIQVIFTTEQTEGRSVEPYLSIQKIDICEECLKSLLRNKNYIVASGAQGYNSYYLNNELIKSRK